MSKEQLENTIELLGRVRHLLAGADNLVVQELQQLNARLEVEGRQDAAKRAEQSGADLARRVSALVVAELRQFENLNRADRVPAATTPSLD